MVGTDHGLATATVIGRSMDFDAILNNFFVTQNIWVRFGLTKFIYNARDKNCIMTSKKRRGREFTRNYGGRKGSQRNHFQLARALKGQVVESSARHSPDDSAMIRDHRSLSDDISINIHNNI